LLEPAVHTLREDEFERYIARNELPVMVDFWATWCGPCQMMAPHFEHAAERLRGRALCAKLDIDQAPAIAHRRGIRSVPTVIVFAGGKERVRHTGAAPESQLIELVERAITT
jgi:thioredoxin 2